MNWAGRERSRRFCGPPALALLAGYSWVRNNTVRPSDPPLAVVNRERLSRSQASLPLHALNFVPSDTASFTWGLSSPTRAAVRLRSRSPRLVGVFGGGYNDLSFLVPRR